MQNYQRSRCNFWEESANIFLVVVFFPIFLKRIFLKINFITLNVFNLYRKLFNKLFLRRQLIRPLILVQAQEIFGAWLLCSFCDL